MIQQIEIIQSGYTGNFWVIFRDQLDLDANLRGRVYNRPSVTSLDRLGRAINLYTQITLRRDGYSFIVQANRDFDLARLRAVNAQLVEACRFSRDRFAELGNGKTFWSEDGYPVFNATFVEMLDAALAAARDAV